VILDERETLRRSPAPIEEALRAAGAQFSNPRSMRCPFHDDKSPSAWVKATDQGVFRFHCKGASCGFATKYPQGGDVFDVREYGGNRSAADQIADLKRGIDRPPKAVTIYPSVEALREAVSAKHGFPVAQTDPYTNPDTLIPDLIVFRIEPPNEKKRFSQGRPEGNGFCNLGLSGKWPLFNRIRMRSASEVLFVEGEGVVRALHEIGIVATTGPGGCAKGNADRLDLSPLSGKHVWLWPDNDEPGADGIIQATEHMRAVAENCRKLPDPPELRWIDPAKLKLPPKGDAVEFLAQFAGTDEKLGALQAVLDDAISMDASGELHTYLRRIGSGEIQNIPWPWPQLTRMTCALLPGSVTVLCGDAGIGKTFYILQCLMHWIDKGVNSAVLFIEKDRRFHMHRLLALLEGRGCMIDYEWIKANISEIDAAIDRHRMRIDLLGRHVHSAPEDQLTLDSLLGWIRQQASAGRRIIVVDPITAVSAGPARWEEDQSFMYEAQKLCTRHEASLVIVTHPKKGNRQGKSTGHDIAGGAAYDRFCDCEIWLHRTPKPRKIQYRTFLAGQKIINAGKFNLFFQINKARNARGTSMEIAFTFGDALAEIESERLVYAEQGVVLKDVPDEEIQAP
jgi:KaiC/GvpD/RAD55 family RecA-like ATPase